MGRLFGLFGRLFFCVFSVLRHLKVKGRMQRALKQLGRCPLQFPHGLARVSKHVRKRGTDHLLAFSASNELQACFKMTFTCRSAGRNYFHSSGKQFGLVAESLSNCKPKNGDFPREVEMSNCTCSGQS